MRSPIRATQLVMRTTWPLLCPTSRISLSLYSSRKALAASSLLPDKDRKKVIVISGPTGAGKSKLALEIARRLEGEIISADSVQVYRGLDVGSAKPSVSETNEVPHHLIDILHASEDYSAGQFFSDARRATEDVLEKGRVPIVVGGTGLYLRWYIYGKPDVPKPSLEIVSAVSSELIDFQKSGQWDEAVELVVKAGDPEARHFPPNNWYRLRRSLEILRSSGSPPTAFAVPYNEFCEQVDGAETSSTKELDYDFICVFLTCPRVDLYRWIDLRSEKMLMDTQGLLSEASWLLDIGLHPNVNSATRAIGYRQAMEYLMYCRQGCGRSSPQDFFSFLSEFQTTSRNFAKRQITWFRNEKFYQWVDASQPFEAVIEFLCNAYHDPNARVVPESLEMKRESSRRETNDLKAYRAKNRVFLDDKDCYPILDWIGRTQRKN